MRPFVILLAALIGSASLADEPKPATDFSPWMKLSVRVQNVAWVFQRLHPSGQPDPSGFTDDLKEIDRLLSILVTEGAVSKSTVKLRAPKGREKDYEEIMKFTEKLGETCGQYVALELMDLIFRKSLKDWSREHKFQPDAHVAPWIVIAIPKRERPDEQGGAGQPATRPESESEGGDKPQPEAEGRSR
jgi:hypothetical protein